MKRKWFSLFLLLSVLTISSCKQTPKEEESPQPSGDEVEPYIPIDDNPKEDTPSDIDDGGEEIPQVEPPVDYSPYITGISITNPDKLVYETGDELDLTGLVVTAHLSNDTDVNIDLNQITLSSYDMNQEGYQTITVNYLEFHASIQILINRKYDEPVDSEATSDLTDLYNAFQTPVNNYMSSTESFFNSVGAYDYYRHYQKNCIQQKVNYYTNLTQYSYPVRDEYLEILNKGYYNQNGNYYSYSLRGNTVSERLASSLSQEDLSLVKSDASYQDDMFTLGDLNQTYFDNNEFVKVGDNKYQTTKKESFPDFIDICSPELINDGYYMTFSKVTIELDPKDNVKYRIRLYASKTQSGKLIDTHLDETNRPNWYLLFAEALIYDVNTTSFAPIGGLINK